MILSAVLLNTLEEIYMAKFNSITNGFNIRNGGGNKTHHPESIKKMSESSINPDIHHSKVPISDQFMNKGTVS